MQSRFIVLEGLDGAGKTTLAPRLQNFIASHGIAVEVANDPGTTPLGQLIRPTIKTAGVYPEKLTEWEQFIIFGTAKLSLKYEVIRQARAANRWLVSDRFNLGGLVYQGYANRESFMGFRQWLHMEELTFSMLREDWPDLTLVLDVPAEVGFTRRHTARGDGSCFEDKGLPFMQKVREGYQYYASQLDNTVLLDATRPEEEVFAAACHEVTTRFLT